LSRDFRPANVLEFRSDMYFCSAYGPFEWIEFTFTRYDVAVAGYALKMTEERAGPAGWRLEGSIDGGHWQTMHEVIEPTKSATMQFEVPGQWGPQRCLRLVQIVPPGPKNLQFALGGVEFFGVLRQHNN
jgi:hypothetical protein